MATIRAKRAAMERAEKLRDEKRRQLVEGANEKNLELMKIMRTEPQVTSVLTIKFSKNLLKECPIIKLMML